MAVIESYSHVDILYAIEVSSSTLNRIKSIQLHYKVKTNFL